MGLNSAGNRQDEMQSFTWTIVSAFACGLLVYAAIVQWLPEVDINLMSGIVGFCALAGAALGKTISARLVRRRSAGRT